MVQAPPRPTEPTEPQVNIELDDLQELARINPMAWEQLLHIVDNRQNQARIADLEERLELVDSTLADYRVATKAELVSKNGKVPELK